MELCMHVNENKGNGTWRAFVVFVKGTYRRKPILSDSLCTSQNKTTTTKNKRAMERRKERSKEESKQARKGSGDSRSQ